ncbi:MAG: hypothetical protein NDJ89_11350 [Oligoflexia bacterium]|nr:hypothetical protein [Oligoflexia bacterium]
MSPDFILVYFKGCPHAAKAKALLLQARLEFREVCQDARSTFPRPLNSCDD